MFSILNGLGYSEKDHFAVKSKHGDGENTVEVYSEKDHFAVKSKQEAYSNAASSNSEKDHFAVKSKRGRPGFFAFFIF